MNKRMRVAFWAYMVGLLLPAVFGTIYLFRPRFMPYHADVVGMAWGDLEPGFQILILSFMKAYGASMLAMACAMSALLFKPFRSGEMWVRIAFPIIMLVYTIPVLSVTWNLSAKYDVNQPLIATTIGLILLTVGFLCSISVGTKRESG